jgi:hypothetical protein
VRSIFGGKYRWLWLSVSLLLVALAFRYFFIVKQNTQHENARVVTEKLTREIAVNQPVIGQLKDILIQNQNPSFNTLLIDTKYPYYIFSNKISIFWSKSDFTPNYRDLLGDFSLGYVKTVRGKFIAQKEAFMHQQRLYEIVFMIPLTEEFSIVNKYLKNTHNSQIFTDLNFEITHQSTQSEFEPILIGEKELFSIHFGNTYANSEVSERNVLVVLILLAFAALFIFVKEVLAGYVKHGEIFQGFFFLFLSIISTQKFDVAIEFSIRLRLYRYF